MRRLKRIILPAFALGILGLGGLVAANHPLAATVHAQSTTVQVQRNQPSVSEKEVPDSQEINSGSKETTQESNKPDSGHTDPAGSVDHQFEGTE